MSERLVAVEKLKLVKKINWISPDPKFPPALVSPEIIPRDLLEMNGMMPKVVPQAAWAPIEKRIITRIAILAPPSQMQNTPPRVWRIHKVYCLPLMPKRRVTMSYRPKGRAKKFAIPKEAAMIPAVWTFRSNQS